MSRGAAVPDVIREFVQAQCREVLCGEWVAAVSGGVDSMVLLHALKQVADELGISFRAVHVHHGLRALADRDMQLVKSVCEKLGVPVDIVYINLESIPEKERRGTEADARTLRYGAIANNSIPADGMKSVVFLAHHADDQTETVLMRLVRGTTLTGLAGMRPVREWQGSLWLRPFLTLQKSDLLDYANRHGIAYILDETNADTKYTRNFIRHEVVPRLRQVQPNVNCAIQRLSTVIQAEDDWLESISREHARQLVRQSGENTWTISVVGLQCLPLPLQRRVIKIILYCLAPADWTFDHVDSILRLCGKSLPSAMLNLANQTEVRRVYDELQFRQGSAKAQSPPWNNAEPERMYRAVWQLETETRCAVPTAEDGQTWVFQRAKWQGQRDQTPRLASQYEAVFPYLESLVIQPATPGSRMKVLGLSGTKKLQDLFVDAKIPRTSRWFWPCFYVGEELIWVPGVARSAQFLLGPGSHGWHVSATKSSVFVGHG